MADVRAVFAASVRRARLERNWSLAEMSSRSGIAKGTIINVESQRHGTTLHVASMFAEAFGTSIGALADGPAGGGS